MSAGLVQSAEGTLIRLSGGRSLLPGVTATGCVAAERPPLGRVWRRYTANRLVNSPPRGASRPHTQAHGGGATSAAEALYRRLDVE